MTSKLLKLLSLYRREAGQCFMVFREIRPFNIMGCLSGFQFAHNTIPHLCPWSLCSLLEYTALILGITRDARLALLVKPLNPFLLIFPTYCVVIHNSLELFCSVSFDFEFSVFSKISRMSFKLSCE